MQSRKFIAFYCPTCHILTVSENMKYAIAILITYLLPYGCSAQTSEPFSFSKRELLEGAKNEVKVLPNLGQKIVSVSVSNGRISSGVKTNMVRRNGQTVNTKDSIYFWTLCESQIGVEELYIKSRRGDSLFNETVNFIVNTGPILSVKPYRETGEKSIWKSTSTENVTPMNLEGISLRGTSLEYGFSVLIEQFSIEVVRRNKIVNILENIGTKLTDINKDIIRSSKGDYLRIKDIIAHLDCGLELQIKDPNTIHY